MGRKCTSHRREVTQLYQETMTGIMKTPSAGTVAVTFNGKLPNEASRQKILNIAECRIYGTGCESVSVIPQGTWVGSPTQRY